jgi:hypothetical protein
MADGTTAGLSRTTSDSTNARTYTRTTVNSNSTLTTLQDEKGNQTVLQFTNYGGDFYETHRRAYQGAVGGTPLLERPACLSRNTNPCDGTALDGQIDRDIADRLDWIAFEENRPNFDAIANV